MYMGPNGESYANAHPIYPSGEHAHHADDIATTHHCSPPPPSSGGVSGMLPTLPRGGGRTPCPRRPRYPWGGGAAGGRGTALPVIQLPPAWRLYLYIMQRRRRRRDDDDGDDDDDAQRACSPSLKLTQTVAAWPALHGRCGNIARAEPPREGRGARRGKPPPRLVAEVKATNGYGGVGVVVVVFVVVVVVIVVVVVVAVTHPRRNHPITPPTESSSIPSIPIRSNHNHPSLSMTHMMRCPMRT